MTAQLKDLTFENLLEIYQNDDLAASRFPHSAKPAGDQYLQSLTNRESRPRKLDPKHKSPCTKMLDIFKKELQKELDLEFVILNTKINLKKVDSFQSAIFTYKFYTISSNRKRIEHESNAFLISSQDNVADIMNFLEFSFRYLRSINLAQYQAQQLTLWAQPKSKTLVMDKKRLLTLTNLNKLRRDYSSELAKRCGSGEQTLGEDLSELESWTKSLSGKDPFMFMSILHYGQSLKAYKEKHPETQDAYVIETSETGVFRRVQVLDKDFYDYFKGPKSAHTTKGKEQIRRWLKENNNVMLPMPRIFDDGIATIRSRIFDFRTINIFGKKTKLAATIEVNTNLLASYEDTHACFNLETIFESRIKYFAYADKKNIEAQEEFNKIIDNSKYGKIEFAKYYVKYRLTDFEDCLFHLYMLLKEIKSKDKKQTINKETMHMGLNNFNDRLFNHLKSNDRASSYNSPVFKSVKSCLLITILEIAKQKGVEWLQDYRIVGEKYEFTYHVNFDKNPEYKKTIKVKSLEN